MSGVYIYFNFDIEILWFINTDVLHDNYFRLFMDLYVVLFTRSSFVINRIAVHTYDIIYAHGQRVCVSIVSVHVSSVNSGSPGTVTNSREESACGARMNGEIVTRARVRRFMSRDWSLARLDTTRFVSRPKYVYPRCAHIPRARTPLIVYFTRSTKNDKEPRGRANRFRVHIRFRRSV